MNFHGGGQIQSWPTLEIFISPSGGNVPPSILMENAGDILTETRGSILLE